MNLDLDKPTVWVFLICVAIFTAYVGGFMSGWMVRASFPEKQQPPTYISTFETVPPIRR